VHAGGIEATLARLTANDERGRMRSEMLDRSRSHWDNFWKWSGPDGIVISDISSGRYPEFLGKTLTQAACLKHQINQVSEEAAADFALDLLAGERMGVGMISFSQSEEVVRKIMHEPYVNVCTDGLLSGKPHPRAYGTYPRMLGRYVRELNWLTFEGAVHKMSGLAAETFQLEGYGRIAAGTRANLVVFDPMRVIDRATFANSQQYPEGISYVFVEGRLTLRGESQIESGGSGVTVRKAGNTSRR